MNNSKKLLVCLISVGFLTVFLLLPGCDLLSTTIDGRISALVSDLNRTGERGIVDNFHPDMTLRGAWNADAAFDVTPLRQAFKTFSITLSGVPLDIGGGIRTQNGNRHSTTDPVQDRA